MRRTFVILVVLLAIAAINAFSQNTSDEGGRVLALETAWGHAIELKDTKALDQMIGSTFVAVEIDGSVSTKAEFLAGIKDPSYQPLASYQRADKRSSLWQCCRRYRNLSRKGSRERQALRPPRTLH